MDGLLFAPAEFKFIESAAPGEFEGHGSVAHNQDSHGDVILPGAFADTLAEHRSRGMMPGMYVEHSRWNGGDLLPVGVWTHMAEDDKGLAVKGKLSALDTDHGKRVHGLMKDGALRGLSIAFNVPKGGATFGKKAGEPRRTISAVDLVSLDIVRNPSNDLARVEALRSMMTTPKTENAAKSIALAIGLHRQAMTGSGGPTAEQRAALLGHLQDAHESLTGQRMPEGMKQIPDTLDAFAVWLSEQLHISADEARAIGEGGFKSFARVPEPTDTDTGIGDLAAVLAGFSLAT